MSLGRSSTPALQLAAQQTTFMWNTLNETDVKLTALIANRTAVRPLPDKVRPVPRLPWKGADVERRRSVRRSC